MLTIEELKALQVGEWVWITTKGGNGFYGQIDEDTDDNALCIQSEFMPFVYRKYGNTWSAYRNKEEAEGKSITLPYLLCTSRQFACVICRDSDGKVKKTHTYPMQEAKAILIEKEIIQCHMNV